MTMILIPAAIVAGIGLIAAVILTVASKLMFVPVDERVAAVREVLPGANCGGCGFAGCDDYAAAFGKDPELSPSLCPVGGPDVAAKIAAIMGESAGDMEAQVAVVKCQGNCDVTQPIMSTDRIYSCKTAKMFYDGQWACAYGCLGLGDCFDACKFDAIDVYDGLAHIDRDRCVGCGACVDACPNDVIELIVKKNMVQVECRSKDKGAKTRKLCSVGCIGCMKCQKACRFDVITVEGNLAHIDPQKCRNCGMCVKECPTGAIADYRKRKMEAAAGADAV